MSANNLNYIEVRNKIIEGCHIAIKKLIEERKKTNGDLVIMVKGKITHVPAKYL